MCMKDDAKIRMRRFREQGADVEVLLSVEELKRAENVTCEFISDIR